MELTRLGFLKLAGFVVGSLAFGSSAWAITLDENQPQLTESNAKGMLIDITKCVGCRMCQVACQKQNGLKGGEKAEELSANAWTVVKTFEINQNGKQVKRFVRNQCFHCLDPACASACLVGALRKTPEGSVIYDAWKCIGCRYCMIACPFEVPKYEWEKTAPLVTKCIFCYSRIKNGQQPACAEACPTQATLFGTRKELVQEAQKRIKENPGKYVNHIYGLEEAGGTSFIFLSDVPFEQLGFKTEITRKPLPTYTWRVLSKIPGIIVGAGAILTSTYLLTHKNEQIVEQSHQGKEA